ncbi:YqgE/AlgH family protein [Sphingobacterium bovistauri]|uniref:YqgE/AlgH family protein n=1 Tax=Sphingobacterium bovistauri TaxID=2781959 RepID=A0ABS7Z0T7_9SPHI|nr:YqgE/AlgH family protein [Sphingobacterium bovistauri]MCA5003784.1 YqgE/AlgH family protein [Sphingobacterium bovistauri]
MFNADTPQQGSLLLSEPFMLDPNFERSVVLLCEQNEDGTIGIILNHRSNLLLSDVMDSIITPFPLYLGGPVQDNALFFIHRAFDKIEDGTHIYDDIYWGGDFDLAVELINKGTLSSDEIKFFLGYSGWADGQLTDEINLNSWAVHNRFSTELTFITDGEDLWKQALISLGPKYAHVANFPKSPNLN